MTEQTPRVDEPTVQEILVRDPLTPVTRKERLYLLAVSMIGIAMVRTGLVPSKIATFGIELDKPNRHALLFFACPRYHLLPYRVRYLRGF